jgi:mRNA-degrading endonuclease RelE of RelBE toxin-antitoxin system
MSGKQRMKQTPMQVLLSPKAEKDLRKINEPRKSHIKNGLRRLSLEPLQGDIAKLKGCEGFRLRIGGYRVLFNLRDGKILVTDIEPRGGAYKGA